MKFCYEEKFNILIILIEAVIKFNSKIYKLAIKKWYSKLNTKIRFYFRYLNYFDKYLKINE